MAGNELTQEVLRELIAIRRVAEKLCDAMAGNRTMTKKEFAERVGLSVATVSRDMAKQIVPHLKRGRRVLFTEKHAEQYLAQFEQPVKTLEQARVRRRK